MVCRQVLVTPSRHRRSSGPDAIELRIRAAVRIQRWYKFRQNQAILRDGSQGKVLGSLALLRKDGSKETLSSSEAVLTHSESRLKQKKAAILIQKHLQMYQARKTVANIVKQQREEQQMEELKRKLSALSSTLYDGLDIYDQSYMMWSYKLVFNGEHAIRYMVDNQLSADEEQAQRKGQLLLDFGLILDVSGNQTFKNSDSAFYRFQQDQDQLDLDAGHVIRHRTKKSSTPALPYERIDSVMHPEILFKTCVSQNGTMRGLTARLLSNQGDSSKETLDDDDVEGIFHKLKEGIKPRTMVYRFRTYRDVFYGEEVVLWILKNTHCRTVEQAIDLGNMLVIRRYFGHFLEDRPLENKRIFYKFTDLSKHSVTRFYPQSEDRAWITDWKWKLLLHSIVSDCNKKYQEKKLIGLVARKLKRQHMMLKLVKNMRVMAVPFFRFLPQDIYSQITKLCSYQVFDEESVLQKIGDPSKRLSVILLGCATLEDGDLSVQADNGYFSPSCCFGEETLRDKPTAATIIGSSAGILFNLQLDNVDLEKILLQSRNKELAAQALIYLKSDECSFRDIKNYPKAWIMLKSFMTEEFAAENTNFIEKVEEFKATNDNKLRLKMALSIYQIFLSKDSLQEVNVTSHQRVAVEAALKTIIGGAIPTDGTIEQCTGNLQVHTDLFDECYQEIWYLIEKDKFTRFKESMAFKVLLFKLGALQLDPTKVEKVCRKLGGKKNTRNVMSISREQSSLTGASLFYDDDADDA